MKRPTYLNAVLTAITVLLAAHLWVSIADQPLLARDANAQVAAPGIPNAGLQRQQMVKELQTLNRQVDRLVKAIDEAEFDVKVTNVKDFAQNNTSD